MTRFFRALRRFRTNEDGTATVEFVILFPAFVLVLLSSIESGIMMVRNVMLERSLDLAVRELRIGSTAPDFNGLKEKICDRALLIWHCSDRLQMELEPVSMTTFALPSMAPKCRDVTSDIDPVTETTWDPGKSNELMIVRVCALFDPFFAPSAWAMKMPTDGNGHYALVAKTAFVNEPSE